MRLVHLNLIVGLASLQAFAVQMQGATCSVQSRSDCYPNKTYRGNLTVDLCLAHGCCFDTSSPSGEDWCFYPSIQAPVQTQCSAVSVASRLDCHPEVDASQESCQARGCCWESDAESQEKDVYGVPFCFFPHVSGYGMSGLEPTQAGATATLHKLDGERTPFLNDIATLQLNIWEETTDRLRIRITDPQVARFEPPIPLGPAKAPASKPSSTSYAYQGTSAPFGISVTRTGTDGLEGAASPMLNMTPPAQLAGGATGSSFGGLVYDNQMIEFSTQLPARASLFGLGEHVAPLRLSQEESPGTIGAGQVYTIQARDRGTPEHSASGNTNLYGQHPLLVVVDEDTMLAHGIFFYTAAAMDVVLQPGAATFRSIGGILDVFVFSGPTVMDVSRQYAELVGLPAMIPYFGLGFQLCRWGYDGIAEVQNVTREMQLASLPQEVQWNDIDYMDQHLDFTLDPTTYNPTVVSAWLSQWRASGHRYVQIVDPGISATQAPGQYPALDDLKECGCYLKQPNGSATIGVVWPGPCLFPDFLHPDAPAYWEKQWRRYYTDYNITLDGVWMDMNEIALIQEQPHEDEGVDGTGVIESGTMQGAAVVIVVPPGLAAAAGAVAIDLAVLRGSRNMATSSIQQVVNGSGFDPQNPPFLPGRLGGATWIDEKTIHFDTHSYAGLEYDSHGLYGYSEMRVTRMAQEAIESTRKIYISRSTFPGAGAVGGHWLGDNTATWDDLARSIQGTLLFNILAVPYVGADTCGFNNPTNAELCTRWMQAAAVTQGFYRNHNSINMPNQAPYVFGDPYTSTIRRAMFLRQSLLPYLYTLYWKVSQDGTPVSRALFLEFPQDAAALAVDTSVMLGPALLSAPALQQGQSQVQAYLPQADWFQLESGALVARASDPGAEHTLPAPLDPSSLPANESGVPVLMRGGSIIVRQVPAMTTDASRNNPFIIDVAPSSGSQHQSSSGSFHGRGSVSKRLQVAGDADGELYLDDGEELHPETSGKYTLLSLAHATGSGIRSSGGTLTVSGSQRGYQSASGAVLGEVRVMLGAAGGNCGSPAATLNGVAADAVEFDNVNAVLHASFSSSKVSLTQADVKVEWSC